MKNVAFLFLLILVACHSKKQETIKGENHQKVIHPRIYWTENPASHAIVSWTSLEEGSVHKVYYDTVSQKDRSNYSFYTESGSNGKITVRKEDLLSGVPNAYYHHAELEGLQSSKKYFFRFCSDSTCSPEYFFITADNNAQNLSVLYGGDSRVGEEDEEDNNPAMHATRKKMNKLIAKMIVQKPEIKALIHGADYAMDATWKHLYHWFNDHELTITPDGRVLPLIISRGNHDHEIGFTENFRLGKITEQNSDGYYYTTKLTDSIALITLNTETSMAGYQYKWLKKELPMTRAANKWLLVQYHKPAYPAVKDFNREDFVRVRKYWVPLFEENRIDIALESDGHALKKTVPILNNKPDPKGIIYIGEGGLGVPQRNPHPERWYFKNGGHASSNHHVWLLDIKADTMKVKAFGANGEQILDFYLKSKNK
jgi:acid phosphatase type 7